VVGAVNLLGRSEDKQITTNTPVHIVKLILKEQYLARRRSSSSGSIGNNSRLNRQAGALL
jgi:hypothetical protein